MKKNVRLSTTMDRELLGQVDEYSKRLGVSRSAGISVLVSQALQQEEFLRRFPDFMKAVEMQQGMQGKD